MSRGLLDSSRVATKSRGEVDRRRSVHAVERALDLAFEQSHPVLDQPP
jgi:hypothetical protein